MTSIRERQLAQLDSMQERWRRHVMYALFWRVSLEGRAKLLFHADAPGNDETPMKLKPQNVRPSSSSSLAIVAPPPGAASSGLPEQSSTTPLTVKLFQVQNKYGSVVELMNDERRVRVLLVGRAGAPLKSLSRTTAAVQAAALLEVDCVSPFEDYFDMKWRVPSIDRYSSNEAGEVIVMQQKRNWNYQSYYCEVHMVASTHDRAAAPWKRTTQGIKHVAKSLDTPAGWNDVEDTLYEVILERIVVRVGSCTEDARGHKLMTIEAFLPGGGMSHVRKAALMSLPNGDWRNRSQVEVFVPPGHVVNPYEHSHFLAEALCR